MALSSKVGTFTLRTDTSANAVTGVGFQPIAIIFWGGRETADGSFDDIQFCVGAATGATQRWCALAKSEDGANPAFSTGMAFNNKCFAVYNSSGNGARDAEVDFTSLDAGGFTVTNTTAPGTAYRVNYLALGGADLTAAFAGSRTITTGTGSLATTGVGFQGDTMFAACVNATAFGTSAGGSGLGVGAATSSTARWAMLALSETGVATSDTRARIATNRVGVVADNTFNGNSLSLDFTSWDADGFTLNRVDHASGVTECFGYLVLQGADAAVGTFTTQTGTGTFSTTGLSFKPSALLAAGTMVATATETAPSDHAEMAVGVTDGTTSIAYWTGDVDNVAAPIDNKRRVDSTKFLVNNDRATPFAAEGEIGFTSFNSDGFTLDQTDADGSAFLVGYLALGPGAATAGTTYYLLNTATGDNWGDVQTGGSAPATATTTTGWTVGTTAATNYSKMAFASERAANTFSGTPVPATTPDNSLKDAYRIGPLTGTFAAGDWTVSVPVIADTAQGGADGRIRVRVFKSANADGSSSSELTAGAVQLGIVTDLTTGAQQISSGTVTLGSITLTAEYLFFSFAWEITGAAS